VSQLELVQELQGHRPAAPEALRERVRALAPPPPRRFELDLRRLVPAAGGVALAGALGVAVVVGVLHSGAKISKQATQKQTAPKEIRTPTPHGAALQDRSLSQKLPVYRTALAPTPGRLQQYDAFLRVRVDDQDELSRDTQDALRYTRRLGGYVVWARYGAPAKHGDSELALRVPIGRVQAAIAHFAGYGSLLNQRIVLKDLQKRADKLALRIQAVEADLAAAVRQGQAQRAQKDRERLATLRAQRANTLHRGHFARIALTMVVHKRPAAAAGRFDRTIDEAGSVLAREGEILLYALIVAGPLLLLGLVGIAGARAQRRRADQRLLERT
jgi:hypothetical protein